MAETKTSISNANMGKERILKAEINDITKSFIEGMFSAYHDRATGTFKEAPFNPTDKIKLTPSEYKWIKGESIDTTLGRLVMNRYMLERTGLIQFIGYWNNPLDKKSLGKLDSAVVNLVILDKIDIDTYGEYIDSRDRLGFWVTSYTSVSISAGLIRPMPDVEKRKAEILKERSADINSEDAVTQIIAVNDMEKELMGMVRKNLQNDPGYDMYASGDGNLDNNYKTINVMRGAVFNNITKRYDVVESSLMNGIKKKDIAAFSNSVLAGAYPSAIGTAEAGYMSKIIMTLLQSEHLDPDPNSDCGTTKTIPITITENNKRYMLYRNFNIAGKTVMTTIENIDKFVGQTVRMYSPMCCTHDAICGKCAGLVFHNLGVTNIGLLTSDITDKLLNLKLKSKHDLSQNAGIISANHIFLHANPYFSIEGAGTLVNKAEMKMFIPRMLDKMSGFYLENTCVTTMGIFPVKFYDKNGKELMSTMMTIPGMLSFNIYNDIQETEDHFIVSYDPGSNICSLKIQKSPVNAEFFINQIYLHSSVPQLPYNLITEMMFRCLEINNVDLTGPSIAYELLARAVCRSGNKSFAKVYGKPGEVDPMSYTKFRYREAVQRSGILQGILFEDISQSLNVGLAQTLNGIDPTPTPLEKIIRA